MTDSTQTNDPVGSDATRMVDEIPADNSLTADAPENDTLEEIAGAEQHYGEVTAEDLSVDDLVNDGADLLQGEEDQVSRLREVDDPAEETIDERIAQEEYDPASAIVPEPGGSDLDLTDPVNGLDENLADAVDEATAE